ncbi:MAG: PAS domain-containing sensor histidine kinase, partial [Syntrophorhabdus sp.]
MAGHTKIKGAPVSVASKNPRSVHTKPDKRMQQLSATGKDDMPVARQRRMGNPGNSYLGKAPVAIALFDEGGVVLKANDRLARLIGVDARSLAGISFFRFLSDGSKTTFRYYLEELLVSGEESLSELTIIGKDKSRVRVVIRSSVMTRDNRPVISSAIINLGHDASHLSPVAANESLKSFADNIPDCIFRLDKNLKHIFVNPMMVGLSGLKREELLDSSLNDWTFLDNETLGTVRQSIRNVFGTLEAQEFELTFDREGVRTYFNLRLIPEVGADGNADTILGIMRDTTVLKRNEEVIETEHSFREAIGRSLSIGIGAIDDHGRQIYVNPAFCRILGWSNEELIGKRFPYVYWPKDEIKKARRIFVRIRKDTKTSGSFELTLQRRDGTLFEALIMYSSFYDNAGRRIGWIGSVGDISGLKRKEKELQRLNRDLDSMVRKRTESLRVQNRNLRDILMGLNRAQEELRLSETRVLLEKQRLETILNVVPAGVIVVEGREGRIAFANRIAQSLFGHKPPANFEMMDSLLHLDVLKPDGQIYPFEELPLSRSLLNGETVRGEEMVLIRPDGQTVPVLANTTPFIIGGEIIGAVGSFVDITRIKQSEESIKNLNTELAKNLLLVEDTNKELEAFVQSVTHDIRSPLVVINGFSRRLLGLSPEVFAEKSQDYIEYIRETSQNALFLVRDLLRLFKIARGEIHKTVVDIGQMASSLQHYFWGLYPGRSVKMITHDDMRIPADYNLIKIVLENLIGNSYKFTAKNTGDTVIEIGAYQSEEGMVIFIRDNGCGFDMTKAGRIFQPFARFHEETEYKGTGIGLATVKRIIHRHGGRIWA